MEVVNVIVIKNNVLERNIALIGTPQSSVVQQGKYAGKSLMTVAEDLFYNECKKANPNLPEEMLSDEEEIPDDVEYPEMEAGVYDYTDSNMNQYYICINWAGMP